MCVCVTIKDDDDDDDDDVDELLYFLKDLLLAL